MPNIATANHNVTQTFGSAATLQFHDEESPPKQIDNQLMMMMMMMMKISNWLNEINEISNKIIVFH